MVPSVVVYSVTEELPVSSIHQRRAGRFTLFLVLAFLFAATAAPAKETSLTVILSALERTRTLQEMDNHRRYELEARGVKVSGFPDDFLRRRTPAEILESGLSCGCGDYASSFYWLVASKGFQALYIDAVALNYGSVEGGDSGHTGVAVKDKESGNWILVDPTNNKVISGDWDPSSRIYESTPGHFWIGYKGPLGRYPVDDHRGLREFYAATLKSVPKDIWEKELLAFEFKVDDSLKDKDGTYTNRNTAAFLERPTKIQRELEIHPARTVKVTLKSWHKKTGKADVIQEADGTWTCFVEEHGRISASLTDWIMAAVKRRNAPIAEPAN